MWSLNQTSFFFSSATGPILNNSALPTFFLNNLASSTVSIPFPVTTISSFSAPLNATDSTPASLMHLYYYTMIILTNQINTHTRRHIFTCMMHIPKAVAAIFMALVRDFFSSTIVILITTLCWNPKQKQKNVSLHNSNTKGLYNLKTIRPGINKKNCVCLCVYLLFTSFILLILVVVRKRFADFALLCGTFFCVGDWMKEEYL